MSRTGSVSYTHLLAIDDHTAHIDVQFANIHRIPVNWLAQESGLVGGLALGRCLGSHLGPLLHRRGISLAADGLSLTEDSFRIVAFLLGFLKAQGYHLAKLLMDSALHPAQEWVHQIRAASFQVQDQHIPLLFQLCPREQTVGRRKQLRNLLPQPRERDLSPAIRLHRPQNDPIHLIGRGQGLLQLLEPGIIGIRFHRDIQNDLCLLLI